MAKTVVGLFSHLSEAQIAVRRLVEAGTPRGDISIVAHKPDNDVTTAPSEEARETPLRDNPAYPTMEPDLTDGVVTGGSSPIRRPSV